MQWRYITVGWLAIATWICGSEVLHEAIKQVEHARKQTHRTFTIALPDIAKAAERNSSGFVAQVIEASALGETAEAVADVEIAKSNAMRRIAAAVDRIEHAPEKNKAHVRSRAMAEIAAAIASVEVAKEKAKQTLLRSGHEVAKSRIRHADTPPPPHAKAHMQIIKNDTAIKIAQAVSRTEIIKAVNRVELARDIRIHHPAKPTEEDRRRIAAIEADAAAKISSYVAYLETVKATMLANIARQVARVEVAKAEAGLHDLAPSHYPKKLLHANPKKK